MRKVLALTVLAIFVAGLSAFAADTAGSRAIDKAIADVLKAPSDTSATATIMRSPAAPAYTGLQATLVVGGYSSTGIPCFSCANGGGGFDVSLPIPISATTAGSAFTFVVMMNSDTYTGACSTAYVIINSASQKVAGGNFVWTAGCAPNNIYMVSWPKTLNLPAGDYTVVGVATGATTSKTVTYLRMN